MITNCTETIDGSVWVQHIEIYSYLNFNELADHVERIKTLVLNEHWRDVRITHADLDTIEITFYMRATENRQ